MSMPKRLGLFYAVLPTAPLYILWETFITVQVTLHIPYNWGSNAMLVKKTFLTYWTLWFVEPQGGYWRSSYHNQNNLEYVQMDVSKFKPERNIYIVVPTTYGLSKQNLS